MAFLILLFVLGSVLFFGLPLIFLAGTNKEDDKLFLLAPFLGIALLVLLLQNLVYLNVTLKQGTWFLWGIGIIVWGIIIGCKKIIWPSKNIQRVLITAFIALMISGWGYLYSGYEECYGNCWIDQFNYVSQSQFLVDNTFNTSFENIDHKPYMIQGVLKKDSRIGQDMLNGFFAVTTFSETKNFFGAVILLTPFLITIAIYLIARNFLSEHHALLAGFLAGIFPIITKLHIENFLSHTLSVPLLFMIVYGIFLIIERKQFVYLLMLSLVISATLNIYFELTYIILGVFVLSVLVLLLNYKQYAKNELRKMAIYFMVLPILIFALNPFFSWKLITNILPNNYFLGEGVLEHIYSFAFQRNMIPNLFLGDTIFRHVSEIFNVGWTEKMILTLNFSSFLLFFISILGWGGLFLKNGLKNPLLIMCLGLLFVPLVVFSYPKHYPYQFFKLMISAAPLLVIGLVLGLKNIIDSMSIKKTFLGISYIFILILFVAANISLIYPGVHKEGMVFIADYPKPNIFKEEKFKNARETLSQIKNKNIVLDSSQHIINAWLSYFARYNNIWFLNDMYGDVLLFGDKGNRGQNFVDIETVPEGALLYTYDDNSLTPFNKEEALKIREAKGYALRPR